MAAPIPEPSSPVSSGLRLETAYPPICEPGPRRSPVLHAAEVGGGWVPPRVPVKSRRFPADHRDMKHSQKQAPKETKQQASPWRIAEGDARAIARTIQIALERSGEQRLMVEFRIVKGGRVVKEICEVCKQEGEGVRIRIGRLKDAPGEVLLKNMCEVCWERFQKNGPPGTSPGTFTGDSPSKSLRRIT